MDSKKFYVNCLTFTNNVVAQIKPKDSTNSTPNTEWNLHDLLNHMVYELAWLAEILQGKTIAEVGNKYDGDLINGNILQFWNKYYIFAANTVEHADINATVHLSYKDCLAGEYIKEVAGDILIHSWDVAKSIKVDDNLPRDLVEQLYEILEPQVSKFQGMGIYGKPIKVDKNSDLQTKLLALLGRDRDWPNK